MTTYGLTATGFLSKSYTVIVTDIGTALKTVFGASITLAAQAVFGQFIGIFGERVSEVWDAAPGTVDLSPVKGEEGPYISPMARPAIYRVDWIRNVPKGFEGRPDLASREWGEERNRWQAEKLAEVIRLIKSYDPATSP